MYHLTKWSSGHTLYYEQIEKSLREIEVKWFQPSKRIPIEEAALEFEAGEHWAKVCCETAKGALQTARYHNPEGKDFALRMSHQEAVAIIQDTAADEIIRPCRLMERQMAAVQGVPSHKAMDALKGAEIELAVEIKADHRKGTK